jgi:hypothetical protein
LFGALGDLCVPLPYRASACGHPAKTDGHTLLLIGDVGDIVLGKVSQASNTKIDLH